MVDLYTFQMHPLTHVLYFKVIPYLFAFVLMCVAFVVVTMPKSLKTLTMSWLSRRPATLGLFFNDDGGTIVEKLKGNLGQGIFEGEILEYVFKPRPANVGDNEKDALSESEKKTVDNWIQYKHFTEWGSALLIGYIGKSVIVDAKLLEGIEKVDAPDTPKRKEITLLDPRKLKNYFRKTISPGAMKTIKFVNREIGYYMRPELAALKGSAPILAILAVIFLGYLLLSGKIPIPSALTGGP